MNKTVTETTEVREAPKVDSWSACYDAGWQGLIVPEAFAHP
jgi:hypothetical protein